MGRPVVIIDGSHLAYRVAHVFRELSIERDGETIQTGTFFGFFRNVLYLRNKFKEALIVVAWDSAPTARLADNPNYKANRPKTDLGRSVFSVMDVLRMALAACGVLNVAKEGEEADDVAATLTRKYYGNYDTPVYLYSGDNDYLQLVSENNWSRVIKPANGKNHPEQLCDWQWVIQEWGVTPAQLPMMRALIGDSSDNLPGIPRFPRKLAALLARFEVPEALYAYLKKPEGLFEETYKHKVTTKDTANKYLDLLLSNESLIRSNHKMMLMRSDLDLLIPEQTKEPERLKEFFEDLQFNSFLKKWDSEWIPLFFPV